MKFKVIRLSIIIVSLVVSSVSFAAQGGSFILKLGSFTLATPNQTIDVPVLFDATSSSVFSLEFEQTMPNNVSWGTELISYHNTYDSGTGTADSIHVLFNIRKYFDATPHVQPFIGFGLGGSSTTLGGIGIGSGGGLGFQAMAGIKFPLQTVSLIVEYKTISAKPDDAAGTSVDISGNGLFAGIAINF